MSRGIFARLYCKPSLAIFAFLLFSRFTHADGEMTLATGTTAQAAVSSATAIAKNLQSSANNSATSSQNSTSAANNSASTSYNASNQTSNCSAAKDTANDTSAKMKKCSSQAAIGVAAAAAGVAAVKIAMVKDTAACVAKYTGPQIAGLAACKALVTTIGGTQMAALALKAAEAATQEKTCTTEGDEADAVVAANDSCDGNADVVIDSPDDTKSCAANPTSAACASLANVCAKNPEHASCKTYTGSGGDLNSLLAGNGLGSSSLDNGGLFGSGLSTGAGSAGLSTAANNPEKKSLDDDNNGNGGKGKKGRSLADGEGSGSYYGDDDGSGSSFGLGAGKVGPLDANAQGNGFDISTKDGLTMIDKKTGKELTLWQRATRRYQGYQGSRALMFARMEAMRVKAMILVHNKDSNKTKAGTSLDKTNATQASKTSENLRSPASLKK